MTDSWPSPCLANLTSWGNPTDNVSRQLRLVLPQVFIYTLHRLASSLLARQKTSNSHVPDGSENDATFCTNRGLYWLKGYILMQRDAQWSVHFSQLAHFHLQYIFGFACWNCTSELHKTIFRMCYFGLGHSEKYCNRLQDFLTSRTGAGSGQEERKQQK